MASATPAGGSTSGRIGRCSRARVPVGRLAPLVVVVLLASGACSGGGGDLPDGSEVLRRASRAMADVRSVEFRLEVEGPTGSRGVRGASGVLTSKGEARGSVSIEQLGTLLEFDVIVAGGVFYVKGPTGGYQVLPDVLAAQIYDPTALLSDEVGIADLLATSAQATTTGREEVGGREAYRVTARIERPLIADLVALGEGDGPVPATLWVSTEDDRLLQMRIEGPADGGEPSVLVITIDEFDVNTAIESPLP